MKKITSLAFLFLMGSIVSSCSDDDDNSDADNNDQFDNYLQFEQTELELKSGEIAYFGEWLHEDSGLYNYDITLVTTDVSMENGEAVPTDSEFAGIYFELLTSNPDELEPGIYELSNSTEDEAFTFEEGAITINFDYETEEGEYYDITSGTFEVLENESTFELQFEGTTYTGNDFSGYYKGNLITNDYTDFERPTNSALTKKSFFQSISHKK